MTTELVTPGDVIGKATEFKAGKGAYVNDTTIYASLTGTRRIISPLPESLDQVSCFVPSFSSDWFFCYIDMAGFCGFYLEL